MLKERNNNKQNITISSQKQNGGDDTNMRGGWEGEKEITIMIKSKTDKKQQELSSI